MKFLDALKKRKKSLDLAVRICAVVFTFLFGIIMVGEPMMIANAGVINAVLKAETSRTEESEEDANADTDYFKSVNDSVAEVREAGLDMTRRVMEEGAVLLKNDNNTDGVPALPLSSDAKISLYSASSVSPVITGTGSSGDSNNNNNSSAEIDFKTAFESVEGANIKVNPDLWNFYNDNKNTYLRKQSGSWGAYFMINDASWSDIPENVKTNGYGDAAIFVLSRRSGEGNDMGSYYGNDMVKAKWGVSNDMTAGNYLALSPKEITVLKGLKAQKDAGKLKSIIVLMNSANPVQCDFADNPDLGIDALMWCGTLGSVGTQGVANLCAGKVSPSGRLSDTFWKYHYKNPVQANFAIDMYHYDKGVGEWSESVPTDWRTQVSIDSSEAALRNNMDKNSRSTVYAEGIYVGYRYTETRYEDHVLGRDNTGDFDYYDTVSYPFGYGLSYSNFSYSDFTMTRTEKSGSMEDSVYTFTVRVKNEGSVPAKEVVQLYLQKPYTEHDEYAEIEKTSVELVAFEKTEIIPTGEDGYYDVTLTVNERELACYDAKVAGTYILEEGEYYFTVAKDAHEAANNIIKAKDAESVTVAQGNTGEGDAALVVSQYLTDDYTTYSFSTKAQKNGVKAAATKIENQFEKADILYYEGATEDFEYITRSDWEGTVKLGFDEQGNCLNTQVKVTVTDLMFADRYEAMSDPEADYSDTEYPKMGINREVDAAGHLNLIDLRAYADDDDDPRNNTPIPYNDPLWDTLLDELNWEDLTYLLSEGVRLTRAIGCINKPSTIDFNGSVGLVSNYSLGTGNRGLAVTTDDPDKDKLVGYYPCNGIAAATFNKKLMVEYGEQWGEDSLWSGSNGLYGMGINLHRSPYGGRNFEYYSEDPYLMGKIAAEMVVGARSKGLYCYLKHCVLNEQETYRIGGYCWLTEQTMREIYLKPFQIAIEEGGANSVMTAEPAIGVVWSGQQGFVQSVLRDEFGMTGIAVSDFTRDVDGNYLKGLLAGSDLPDGTINELFDNVSSEAGYAALARSMREAAHHILYTVVHSNAMNGVSSSTRIIPITPWWQTALVALRITFTTLFALSMLALAGAVAFDVYLLVTEKRISRDNPPSDVSGGDGPAVEKTES